MSEAMRNRWLPYGVAIVSVAVALLLMLLLDPWLGMTQTPFLLFFGAIVVSAWYGGREPGLLATLLSALLANYFFLHPYPTSTLDLHSISRLLLFSLEGIVIGILSGRLHAEKQRANVNLQKLQASEAKFRRLAESNIIGVVSADTCGAITEANDAFLQMVGYTREDLLAGRVRWDEMTPPDLRHLDVPALEELMAKGVHAPYEKVYLSKEGHRVPILVGTALLEDELQENAISFILDLTERKRVEQRLVVQYAIARALTEATTLADAVPTILQSLCESLGWQIGVIWSVDRHARVLHYVKSWQAPSIDAPAFEADNQETIFALGEGLPGRIWASGQPAWISSLLEAENFPRAESALEVGLRGAFGFPICLEDEILGVIECFSTTIQPPDEDLLQMMASIGSQIGQFMERKRAEEELASSQQLFLSFMNNIPGTAYMKDEQGRYLYTNPAGERAANRQLADIVGQTDFDIVATEVAQQIRDNDIAVLTTGKPIEHVETWPQEDGEHYWMSFKFPFKDSFGRNILAGMSFNITDRKRAETILYQREQEFRALVENSPDVIVRIDKNFRHLYVNPAIEEATGIPPERFIGKTGVELGYPKEIYEPWKEQVQNIFATGQGCFWEFESPVSGRFRHNQSRMVPEFAPDGSVQSVLIVTRDVTEYKQLTQRLQQQAQDLAEANRVKDEFLAVLSHELRSPLNPILGWTHLLRTRKFNETATQQALETIERNTKVLVQLIEDLLDVSRIMRGKLSLNIRPVNLSPIIEAAIETVSLAAQAKSIEIVTRFDLHDGQVLGDASRLQQVVWNLLSNAVKFTPTGGRVEVKLEELQIESEKSQSPILNLKSEISYAQIQISDTGKGISPDFLPYIFDYFRQESSATTRKFGGLGLGLAIVRRLVELHGGTVHATSPGEGLGAIFTVRIPLSKFKLPENSEGLLSHPSLSLEGIKILVVDDEVDARELLVFILEQYGAMVQAVSSAQKALEVVGTWQPDLLVSDIGMPDIDGYMLLRQIRSLPPEQGGTVPAIALTAYAVEADRQQVLQAGFLQHLTKPVEPDELVKAIANALGLDNTKHLSSNTNYL